MTQRYVWDAQNRPGIVGVHKRNALLIAFHPVLLLLTTIFLATQVLRFKGELKHFVSSPLQTNLSHFGEIKPSVWPLPPPCG